LRAGKTAALLQVHGPKRNLDFLTVQLENLVSGEFVPGAARQIHDDAPDRSGYGNGMSKIEDRLAELGVVLPQPVAPVANYVPFVRSGSLVHISGQISIDADGGVKGTVGADLDLEAGKRAARLCAINLIAQMKAACDGDLDRVRRVVKLGGFVQGAADFTQIPAVVNGASDLMVEVFGDAGRHARSAVGVYRLPLGFAVEVDAIVEIA
jgi:enamine deaminase RidA (YjgF/YER057c/UK114 family)